MTDVNKLTVKNKDGEEVTIENLQALYDAHEKAKGDLVTLRGEKKELEAQVDAGSDEELSKWKTRAVKAEAKLSLEGEGVKDADRILKYVNLDGVDFDDEGNLVGLEDRLADVKADFPELFDAKRRAGRNSADIHANTPATPSKTTTEAQVDSLFV